MEVFRSNSFSYIARNPQKTDLQRVIRENYRQVFYDREVHGVTFILEDPALNINLGEFLPVDLNKNRLTTYNPYYLFFGNMKIGA